MHVVLTRIEKIRRVAEKTYSVMIENPQGASQETMEAVAGLARESTEAATGLHDLRLHASEDFENQLKQMSVWAGRARMAGFVVLAIAVLWAAASLLMLQRQIVMPVKELAARLRDIAEGDGDLTKRLRLNSDDEIGQVATSFNLFMDQLQAILREVSSGMVLLASATTQITASSAQTVQTAVRQQSETEEIATAMTEMASSVADASYSTQAAAEKASHAAETARLGGNAVQETVTTMREMSVSVDDAAAKITELGARSKEIGAIVGVIDDIAKRTNLLALNAAIEAARVGEHGRGFAVVAGEVRRLAERTAQATSEINGMVTALQHGTDCVVRTMQRSTEQARLGLAATDRTGESLKDIIAAVEQGTDMITRVAGTTTQQAAGTKQVNASVGRIVTWTRQSAIDAQHSADASAELLSLASKLQMMISKFRVDETDDQWSAQSHAGTRTWSAGFNMEPVAAAR